jgi:hypothetical protein
MIFSKKRIKWYLLLLFFVICITGIFLLKKQNTEVESFQFIQHYDSKNWDLETVDRGLPFQFLLVNSARSPFSLEVRLGAPNKIGPRALWVYAAQADNHGQLAIEIKGKRIGIVNNQTSEALGVPKLKLSHVGDINIGTGDLNIKILGFNDRYDRHFAELGLIVFAPIGMTEENILSELRGGGSAYGADFGILLIVLSAAYVILALLKRQSESNNSVIRLNDRLSIVVLIGVCCFTYLFCIGSVNPPLATKNNGARVGIERGVDAAFKGLVLGIKNTMLKIAPNREQDDIVPIHLQTSVGSFETSIYRINQADKSNVTSTGIFFGVFSEIQKMPAKDLKLILTCLITAILSLVIAMRFTLSKWPIIAALGLISILSILVSIRLSEGWDEFFINLRHAYMLNHHGIYSVNALSMIEATVDLVPVLLTALIGYIGINLTDAFIITSLLGNIGLIIFSYLIINKLTQSHTWSLIASIIVGLYPNVIFIGATGFTAILFYSWLLAASYFILYTNRTFLGLALLSSLTLVRTEGILFALLLLAYQYVLKPLPEIIRTGRWRAPLKQGFIYSSFVALPFVLSLIVRHIVFGHSIPNPILFKNTGFDAGFLSVGLDRLVQMISSHDLPIVATLMVLLLAANIFAWKNNSKLDQWRVDIYRLLSLTAICLVFIVPYYIGGGDWFPATWNRYGLPFNLTIVLSSIALLYGAFKFGLDRWIGTAALFVFCGSLFFGYQKTGFQRNDNIFSSALWHFNNSTDTRWSRIDKLASLGQFLGDVLPKDAVIASPEEATIMYFSGREMIGLLGVSTPEMTAMPFQPMNPGNILHRKRAYKVVAQSRPDVIALYEPAVLGNFKGNGDILSRIHVAVQNEMFNPIMVDIDYYRVGSFKALESIGYKHITVSYDDRVYSLFIGSKIYDNFVKSLLSRGFEYLGSDRISYSVNSQLSKKYAPSATAITTNP